MFLCLKCVRVVEWKYAADVKAKACKDCGRYVYPVTEEQRAASINGDALGS